MSGNESFVEGCSFNDGFNVGIGVYGTNNLEVNDNVVHHTVGPCIDLGGKENKLIHNLASYSVAEATYKVSNTLDPCYLRLPDISIRRLSLCLYLPFSRNFYRNLKNV